MANKAELIENVASSTGLTKKDATAAVDAVFSTIQETLAKGEKVQLIGFGNFEVRERALVKDVTHKLDKKFKSSQSKVPHSNQVKH
ncbi:HU family DNA-binding protein [Enterococcus faecalis]